MTCSRKRGRFEQRYIRVLIGAKVSLEMESASVKRFSRVYRARFALSTDMSNSKSELCVNLAQHAPFPRAGHIYKLSSRNLRGENYYVNPALMLHTPTKHFQAFAGEATAHCQSNTT